MHKWDNIGERDNIKVANKIKVLHSVYPFFFLKIQWQRLVMVLMKTESTWILRGAKNGLKILSPDYFFVLHLPPTFPLKCSSSFWCSSSNCCRKKVGTSCNSLTSVFPIFPLLPLLAEKINCGKCGKNGCSSHPVHIIQNTRIRLPLNALSCQKLPGQRPKRFPQKWHDLIFLFLTRRPCGCDILWKFVCLPPLKVVATPVLVSNIFNRAYQTRLNRKINEL